jgi:hypothetical protein
MKKVLLIIVLVVVGIGILYTRLIRNDKVLSGNNVPTVAPAGKVTIPDGWKTYNSETLKYSISYPESYNVEANGENSIIIQKPLKTPSVGPANFVYVSVVTEDKYENDGAVYNFNDDDYEKLMDLDIGDSVSFAASDQPELSKWFTYNRIEDTVIDGQPTRRFENKSPWEFPPGTKEVRYIFEDDGVIYVLGYYYGGDGLENTIDPYEAFNIVSTFKLR